MKPKTIQLPFHAGPTTDTITVKLEREPDFARYLGTIRIGAVDFHVEGIEVTVDRRGVVEVVDPDFDGILQDYYDAEDQPPQVVEVQGMKVFVRVYPFVR